VMFKNHLSLLINAFKKQTILLLIIIPYVANAAPIEMYQSAISLDTADPDRTSVGELEYLGGLRLRSSNPSFGGLSGLWVNPKGNHLVAITDQGAWFTADILYDEVGKLLGLTNTEIIQMKGIDSLPLLPPWSDAESIAVSGKKLFVSFERQNRLYLYGQPEKPWTVIPKWLSLPEKIADGPRNGGLEAITPLIDGRLLVFAEEIYTEDGLAVWIIDNEVSEELTLISQGGFLPTGADILPSGDILLLERKFSLLGGFAARLRKISHEEIVPGAKITGKEIALFVPPLTTDNFEAISVIQKDDGSNLIFLLSDDNFSALQKTLLLMFRNTN